MYGVYEDIVEQITVIICPLLHLQTQNIAYPFCLKVISNWYLNFLKSDHICVPQTSVYISILESLELENI